MFDAGRRIAQAVARYRQAGGVGHGGALDRRFGAVEKTVEHLGVQAAALRLLGREAVVAPDGVGRRLAEMRQPLVAATGRDDRKSAGAGPIDEVADQRGLIAERERIHDPRLLGLVREQRATKRIGLDGDVDHVLAVGERFEAVIDRGNRVPGAFDDDVDRRVANQRAPVVAHVRGAFLHRRVERRHLRALRLPADAGEVGARTLRR
jgi:hypothetical protein